MESSRIFTPSKNSDLEKLIFLFKYFYFLDIAFKIKQDGMFEYRETTSNEDSSKSSEIVNLSVVNFNSVVFFIVDLHEDSAC